MKLSFLFGAGISLPSKVASTQEITDRIFSGKDVVRYTDESYFIDPDFPLEPTELYRKNIDRNIEFLKILSEYTSNYYKQYTNRKWNYEDLYYLLEELYQEVSGDTDNPMTKQFLNTLEPLIKHYFTPRDIEIRHINDLLNFFSDVRNYMKCIVESMLGFKTNNINGLDFLKSMNSDKGIEKANIFTLNHDLLLEEYFRQNRVDVNDGFSPPINNVRYWEPKSYLNIASRINLYKVHGSVNWYRLREDDSDWHDEEIGIVIDGNLHRSKNRKGNCQFPCDSHSLILVGTFNKLAEYSSGIYMDLLCLFNKNLNDSDNLIISGYSFGDKGINARITDWAYRSRKKRIIVINPDIKGLKNIARGSIRNKWDSWLTMDKLRIIEKGIQDTTWEDIKINLLVKQ